MMMQANVYQINGEVEKKIGLPNIFEKAHRSDLIQRALLSEQSARYQPQGHYLLAGLQTTAEYVGETSAYRSLRHVGLAIRPRQKLAKGAMGAVRKVPSAVKGKRAHPHKIEKTIFERINRKEYVKALESAVAATADADLILANHVYPKKEFPIIVSSSIEKISKTKDLVKILKALEFSSDLERSHAPRLKHGLRRRSKKRYFRSSVLIVAKDVSSLAKAGRNIPGVDVACVDALRIELLAPGAKPRLTLWSESAIESVEKSVAGAKPARVAW